MIYYRFEIEKKLRMAKKQEMKKKQGKERKYDSAMKMDPKERSKERKKTVEENRGKIDKKAQAMTLLKARREEKKERGNSPMSYFRMPIFCNQIITYIYLF